MNVPRRAYPRVITRYNFANHPLLGERRKGNILKVGRSQMSPAARLLCSTSGTTQKTRRAVYLSDLLSRGTEQKDQW